MSRVVISRTRWEDRFIIKGRPSPQNHIYGLVQDCPNSITNALASLQFCTKPSIYVALSYICDVFVVTTGIGVGSLAGGLVFEHYGAVYMFQGCAGLSIVTLVLYMVAVFCIKRHRHAYAKGNVSTWQTSEYLAIAINVGHIGMILSVDINVLRVINGQTDYKDNIYT